MPAVQPSTMIAWMPGVGAPTVVEPSGGVQTAGYAADQKPPVEWENYIRQNVSDWLLYLSQLTQNISMNYQGFVGTAHPTQQYATIAAAVAALPAGSRILVCESMNISAIQQITKNDFEVHLASGVTLTKNGVTSGIQVSATGVRIKGGRFAGFSGGSDQAILIDSGSDYTMISEVRFASNNTAGITDNNGKSAIFGNIDE